MPKTTSDMKLCSLINKLKATISDNISMQSPPHITAEELQNLINDHTPDINMHCVCLYFTTCTMQEAIDEINIMLKNANYPPIDETDCIDYHEADHEDDWFDDYNFTFETYLYGDEKEITERLSAVHLSFEIIDE